jgi:SP family general alpha glucoside:H+ symporter-like MFS transporter
MAPTEGVSATNAHDADAPRPVAFGEVAAATDLEHQLGLWQSLKLYPKATAWSILLSTALIMEGFDIVLVSSLYAFPTFQQKFDSQLPDGTW